MKKQNKIITLTLLSVLALTSCGGGSAEPTEATWWNPTTWDWSWTEYLNPMTWFDKNTEEPADSEEETTSEEAPTTELGRLTLSAFGISNKKTITVTTSPVDAYVDLEWAVNKPQVVITETGQKTADVYVTTYFGGYATITVTDQITGLTATGKVYSVGDFEWGIPGGDYDTNYIDATDSTVVITNTNSINPASSTKKINVTSAQITSGRDAVSADYPEYSPIINWNDMQETVYVHILFKGSYAPMIYNMANSTMYGGNNTTLHENYEPAPSSTRHGNIVSIPVTLVEGENLLFIQARQHANPISGQGSLTAPNVGNHNLTAFKLYRINPVASMSFNDTTFTE